MDYSSTALLALMVHCIVNYNALRNRHYRSDKQAGKAYRWLILSILAFYAFDAIWGVLYDARLIPAVFADTVLYFIAMASTVFFWSRYVVCYLREGTRFTRILSATGFLFLGYMGVVLILNFFAPVLFWFDAEGGYHAADLRYVALSLQVLLFLSSAAYVLVTGIKAEDSVRRRHRAVGIFGVAMAVMVTLQVLFPLLPMYSVGCLLGSCILHTFVLEDMKEDRRLELEEMLRREQKQEEELGSARHLAYTDSLTGVKNTHAYVEATEHLDRNIAAGLQRDFAVIVFDINGLKQTNDTNGHEAGDELIRRACRLICRQFKHSPVFRIGGDEFVAILEEDDFLERRALLASFETAVEENRRRGAVVVSSGMSDYRPGRDNSYRPVFERADHRMYERKERLKAME